MELFYVLLSILLGAGFVLWFFDICVSDEAKANAWNDDGKKSQSSKEEREEKKRNKNRRTVKRK